MPKVKPPADAKAVWEIGSAIEDGASRIHPTQKPVETVKRPIAYHTKPGGLRAAVSAVASPCIAGMACE